MASFNNEQMAIASKHIRLAREELAECANSIYKALETLHTNCDNSELKEIIFEAMAALQMQDIITQRLVKLEDFIQRIDSVVSLPLDSVYLEEFAWENEVSQDDIDAMFIQKG